MFMLQKNQKLRKKRQLQKSQKLCKRSLELQNRGQQKLNQSLRLRQQSLEDALPIEKLYGLKKKQPHQKQEGKRLQLSWKRQLLLLRKQLQKLRLLPKQQNELTKEGQNLLFLAHEVDLVELLPFLLSRFLTILIPIIFQKACQQMRMVSLQLLLLRELQKKARAKETLKEGWLLLHLEALLILMFQHGALKVSLLQNLKSQKFSQEQTLNLPIEWMLLQQKRKEQRHKQKRQVLCSRVLELKDCVRLGKGLRGRSLLQLMLLDMLLTKTLYLLKKLEREQTRESDLKSL